MKKGIILVYIVLMSSICSGQNMEKMMDKFNVQKSEVSGHSFSVGDTITLGVGSLANGEFVSALISPGLFVGKSIPHLPANCNHNRFIIQKIRVTTQGLNSQTSIVIDMGNKTPVWIDVTLAIDKKEILLK